MLDRDVITSVSIFPFGAHQPSPPSSAHPPEVPTLVPSSSAPSSRKPPQVSTPSSLGLSTVSSSLTSSGIDSTTDPLKPASIIPSTTSASITSADQTSKSPDKDTRVTDVEIKAAICGHDETCLASADNDWDDGAYITTRDIHGGVIFRQRRSDGMLVFDDSVHAFNLWGPGRQGFVENGQRSEQRPRHGHKQRQREGQRRSQDKRGQRASRHSKETNAGLAPDADTDIQLQPKTDGNPGRQSSNDTATGIHSAQFLRPVVLMELQPIPVTGWNVKSLNIMCYLPLHGYYPLLLRHPERYDEVLRRAHRTVFDDQPCMQRVRVSAVQYAHGGVRIHDATHTHCGDGLCLLRRTNSDD